MRGDDFRDSQFGLLPHEESGERPGGDDGEGSYDDKYEDKYEDKYAAGPGEKRSVELEYETPNSVKFIWLGTYFFFSLLLTLYNKLVLGSVSAARTVPSCRLRMLISISSSSSHGSSPASTRPSPLWAPARC
jgi:hypothetical protein